MQQRNNVHNMYAYRAASGGINVRSGQRNCTIRYVRQVRSERTAGRAASHITQFVVGMPGTKLRRLET
jgi:hypothetical protein